MACVPVALPTHCGETGSNLDARNAADWTPAAVFDYPAVVLLVGNTQPLCYCTGSLFESKWVLMASHCEDGLALEDIGISLSYPRYHEICEAGSHTSGMRPAGQTRLLGTRPTLVELESEFLSRTTGTLRMADAFDGPPMQPGASVTVVGRGAPTAVRLPRQQ